MCECVCVVTTCLNFRLVDVRVQTVTFWIQWFKTEGGLSRPSITRCVFLLSLCLYFRLDVCVSCGGGETYDGWSTSDADDADSTVLIRRVSEPLWEGSANVFSDQSDRPQCATYAFATVVSKMLSLNYGLRIDRCDTDSIAADGMSSPRACDWVCVCVVQGHDLDLATFLCDASVAVLCAVMSVIWTGSSTFSVT